VAVGYGRHAFLRKGRMAAGKELKNLRKRLKEFKEKVKKM
jgi:hypothetical protein